MNYYDTHAEEFFKNTVNVDMKHIYADFINAIPENSHILDAGCGSGRDTKYFKSEGYTVTAMDASREMCRLASKHTAQEVLHLKFQDMKFRAEFEGIWASSSLLHVPREELAEVLNLLKEALKDNGVLYASFKCGNFEGKRNGRYFTDLTFESAKNLFKDFKILKMWHTEDARKNRNEKWVNILVKK